MRKKKADGTIPKPKQKIYHSQLILIFFSATNPQPPSRYNHVWSPELFFLALRLNCANPVLVPYIFMPNVIKRQLTTCSKSDILSNTIYFYLAYEYQPLTLNCYPDIEFNADHKLTFFIRGVLAFDDVLWMYVRRQINNHQPITEIISPAKIHGRRVLLFTSTKKYNHLNYLLFQSQHFQHKRSSFILGFCTFKSWYSHRLSIIIYHYTLFD